MGDIEKISFIPLTCEITVEEYRERVGKAIEQMNKGSIVLIDLFGGTPCNTVLLLSKTKEIPAIVGVNLSVLIESVLLRGQYKGKELCKKVLENTETSIQIVGI